MGSKAYSLNKMRKNRSPLDSPECRTRSCSDKLRKIRSLQRDIDLKENLSALCNRLCHGPGVNFQTRSVHFHNWNSRNDEHLKWAFISLTSASLSPLIRSKSLWLTWCAWGWRPCSMELLEWLGLGCHVSMGQEMLYHSTTVKVEKSPPLDKVFTKMYFLILVTLEK